jgi:hypothetical protein
MMHLYSFNFVILIAFGVFYYKCGNIEGDYGLLWSGLSVLLISP